MTISDFKVPVSVKAVIAKNDKVVLLQNDRDEWELPGGRLEQNETPEACLAREVQEELGVTITVGQLIDAWIYHVAGKQVLILVYQGSLHPSHNNFVISDEHEAMGFFAEAELDRIGLPRGYRNSIAKVRPHREAA